jgi:alkanesulfonate monooxygenase SsuD/methylene tetrahydromethanopterin reductase-like flavin-dependent oxidoreductase (luciferase family)
VTLSLGAHVGQQNMTMDEMRALWRYLDDAGMDWISAWDHLYEAPPAGGTIPHFEAVATLAALACETTNARLGCLVFYVGYRNPGLLAKAAVTIDHLSGGRFELGLGGGWHEWEADAYGYDFPPVGTRLDMLEEATEIIAGLLAQPADTEEIVRTTYQGEHFRTNNASCLPGPVNGHLPIWIGGVGEKRTLRTVARRADGWNAAYVPAEEFGRLNGVLDTWCEREGRDPGEIERSINLVFAMGADEASAAAIEAGLDAQWGDMAPRIKGGALLGTPEQATERVLAFREAGADMVNIALRAPFDEAALEAYVGQVVPAIRAAG